MLSRIVLVRFDCRRIYYCCTSSSAAGLLATMGEGRLSFLHAADYENWESKVDDVLDDDYIYLLICNHVELAPESLVVNICVAIVRRLTKIQEAKICMIGRIPVRALTELFRPGSAFSASIICVGYRALLTGSEGDFELAFQQFGLSKKISKVDIYSIHMLLCTDEQADRDDFDRRTFHNRMMESLFSSLNNVATLIELKYRDPSGIPLSADSALYWLCCKQREGLEFHGMQISGPLLPALCSTDVHLQSLSLSGIPNINGYINEISMGLQTNRTIQCLRIWESELRPSSLLHILTALKDNATLEFLEIGLEDNKKEICRLSSDIANAIKNVSHLKRLYIRGSLRSSTTIRPFLRGLAQSHSIREAWFRLAVVPDALNDEDMDDEDGDDDGENGDEEGGNDEDGNQITISCRKEFAEFEAALSRNTVLETFTCFCPGPCDVLSDKGKFWLELNEAGRKNLYSNFGDRARWIDKVIEYKDNTSICFHLISENPQVFLPRATNNDDNKEDTTTSTAAARLDTSGRRPRNKKRKVSLPK